MKFLVRTGLDGFVWLSHKLKRVAISLTKWTGKSPVRVHPKHLLSQDEEHYWFLKYVHPKDELLDVGCGNGMNTLKAASRAKRAVGVELNPANLSDAEKHKQAQKVANAEFVLGNGEKPLPFENHVFDKVLCLDVLEHIHERVPLLKEMHRVLKREGLMLLGVPSCESRWRRFLKWSGAFSYSDSDHKIEYTRDGLIQELKEGGFSVEKLMPSVYDTPWVGFIDFIGGISLTLYERIATWKRQKALADPKQSIGFWVLCRPQ